ncbi:MAG: PIN domain-containing protein [Verrucomicrobiota bacterium]
MKNILIDTNIYLEFFQSDNIGKLLKAIEKCADHIFITEQIVSEIRRNQLGVAQKFLDNCYPKKEPKFGVPSHLVTLPAETEKRVADFNNKSKALTLELQAEFEKSLKLIATSSDSVTHSLAKFYAMQVAPSNNDIERATQRKLLGNPPGKPGDPLGDQLTWEQFLAQAQGGKRFWIITKDNDYCEEILNAEHPTLNPFLRSELEAKCGKDIEVFCFRTLAKGLEDFVKKMPVADSQLPTPDVIKEIAAEEQKLMPPPYFYSDPAPPNTCPSCDSKNLFTSGAYLRSRYGGLTLQYICQRCGFLFDTGEFFD